MSVTWEKIGNIFAGICVKVISRDCERDRSRKSLCDIPLFLSPLLRPRPTGHVDRNISVSLSFVKRRSSFRVPALCCAILWLHILEQECKI
nr:MAG TPA: hypothetical protein [Caudoviricetes sp.]